MTPACTDLDALLAPLSAPSACGEDLSFSAEFDQIADMRRADDPTLQQGEWQAPLKVADWPGVAALCEHLLRTRSKDLRLALWWTEAQALIDGHAGLARGLALCAALCDSHWSELHPRMVQGDAEERIGNIAWLLQRLQDLLPQLPVTQDRLGERLSLRTVLLSRQAAIGDPTGAAWATGVATTQNALPLSAANLPHPAKLRQALSETPATHWQSQWNALAQSLAHLRSWQDLVDARLGDDGPSFVAAREALQQAQDEIARLARAAGVPVGSEAPGSAVPWPADGQSATAGNATASPPGPHAGTGAGVTAGLPAPTRAEDRPSPPPRSRTEALLRLQEVARYFRDHEPHSPVAYLADKAVAWGQMPLHQWLAEVIKDPGSMHQIQELLGLPRTDASA